MNGMRAQLFLLTSTVLSVMLLLGVYRWHRERAALQQAVDELATCGAIAADIKAHKDSPKTAFLEEQSEQHITLSIQRAAQVAEIPDSDIIRIVPRPGRRIKNSPHVRQPVDVDVRQATLGQLARFVEELHAMEIGLQPTSIRLEAPRTQPPATGNEVWTCDFVLTYLVFSPE